MYKTSLDLCYGHCDKKLLGYSAGMTSAVCTHLTRKFGKVFTTCDSTNSLVGFDPPCDEVFDDDEYYLGPPQEDDSDSEVSIHS